LITKNYYNSNPITGEHDITELEKTAISVTEHILRTVLMQKGQNVYQGKLSLHAVPYIVSGPGCVSRYSG